MNKTDRLLAIVLELQRRGQLRAEDLAETFERSPRTIYRDILALGEAGVPILAVPGHGYSLMEGYFLPPLSFTTEEAMMVLLGSDSMARNFDAQYRAAAESAVRKIESVLPERLREDVQYLQSNIRVIGRGTDGETKQHELLQTLRRALLDRHTIRFCYHARHSGGSLVREADPYGLAYVRNAWYLAAYCHLRQEIHPFRLDRMEKLEVLSSTFTRPATFWAALEQKNQARTMTVRVLFGWEIARWVREERSYYVTAEEETSDGLLVTLTVRQESEILQWLLSWGSQCRVVEPDSLRAHLAEEARAMLQNYT